MKIRSIILENFRGYRDRQVIPLASLTALVGRNDIGKSTILEALDIFFDGGVVKIEQNDACVFGDPKNVRIGCVFFDLPADIIADKTAKTGLAEEFLLNENGDLEIHKVFNCTLARPKAKTYIKCLYPKDFAPAPFIGLKLEELRKLIRDHSLEDQCNLTSKPSMRAALYQNLENRERVNTELDIEKEDGVSAWESLKSYMPVYVLFKADRESTDQDKEVQGPMTAAIRLALKSLERELSEITESVKKEVVDTANRTLDQLKKFYPEIAAELSPEFREPKWDSVYKLDLQGVDRIPVNKRGSGIRRLILMSFFQAEALKRKEQYQESSGNPVSIVYGIEEPETSQHPHNQELIVGALKQMAEAGDQIVITTHVPNLAGMMPIDGLRFIRKIPENSGPIVEDFGINPEILTDISRSLGVLPSPTAGVKVAICVEGYTDELALNSLGNVLFNSDVIKFSTNDERILWIYYGGDSLKHWVERRNLDKLNIPLVYLRDSDKGFPEQPIKDHVNRLIDVINSRPNSEAIILRKRSIENYLHPNALARISNNQIVIDSNETDLDYAQLHIIIEQKISELLGVVSPVFVPQRADGNEIPLNKSKEIICSAVMGNMTYDELRERSCYTNEEGRTVCEVESWLAAAGRHL